MLESFLTIVTHPLLWIFIGLTVAFFGVQGLVSPRPDHQHRSFDTTGWLRRHYVAIVFALGGAAIVLALVFYVFEVGIAVARLVDRLRLGAAADLTETEAKDLAYGIAVLLGAMVAAATIPFTLLRTWINERTATATEEGLITDRINKAVEGLGAEKTVKKRDFIPITSTSLADISPGAEIERQIQEFTFRGRSGSWESIETTEPNLEVRIGAIYALERISQDSARDHIQIMEILCAYIRQNAGRADVRLPDGEVTPDEWQAWGVEGREYPRLDVDVALKVVERRSEARKRLEEEKGYSLGLERVPLRKIMLWNYALTGANLQNAELQGADLRNGDFKGANLIKANLQGATIWNTNFENALLEGANLQGADIVSANLRCAELPSSFLQKADLRKADLQGAHLQSAVMHGANLAHALLQDANLAQGDLRNVILQEADLRTAFLYFVDFRGADLSKANLKNANLSGSQLASANLDNAILRRTDLAWTRWDENTTLSGAEFQGAAINNVDLS